MYLDKELIDEHTKDIEMLKNKPEVVIPEMPDVKAGDGLDMAQLMNMFACKSPPDNTIKRIEALEKQLANMPKPEVVHVEAKAEAAASTGLDQDAMDKLNDLLRRVQSLETRADKTDRTLGSHDDTLADHERRIKALEAMDMTPSNVTVTGEIDSDAILKQLQLVKVEVNQMRSDFTEYKTKTAQDLEQLKLELIAYTDKETDAVKQTLVKKVDNAVE